MYDVWLKSKLEERMSMSELGKSFEKVEAELDFLRSRWLLLLTLL